MKRRDFIKLSLVTGSAILLPEFTYATDLDVNKITFSDGIYQENSAQTIIVFMYGGASQLAGNISNIQTIESKSQHSYNSYFRSITSTKNGCWKEAGGDAMETLMENGDMTLFRCCYSAARETVNNKAHGECTVQNQKGTFDENAGGILSNLAHILESNKVVNENTLMPFVTMEGESKFYIAGKKPLPGYLKPVGINENFENPYKRGTIRRWYNYTEEERKSAPNTYWKKDEEGGFDPALTNKMDILAQKNNSQGKIKDSFSKRASLSTFIDSISSRKTPDLGENAYPDNDFSKKIEAAIKLLDGNPDTKVVTLGTGGLGGWDDHNEARDYVTRMERLFESLKSAMSHLKSIEKIDQVNIMVFSEFGRNVNLNSANGWDHGNLQNLYILGGKGYFNHKSVVGETIVDNPGSINRLWLKPKNGTYWFEPLSIAATLYKIYGIENPEILTDGYGVIEPLFS
jgi:hypothetical protein